MAKVNSPSESGLAEAPLGDSEKEQLALYYERGLEDVRALDTEATLYKFREYQAEIEKAARVAKAQFAKGFDGSQPQSGNFGVSQIRPGYFGYDTWDNTPDAQVGTAVDWIDAGTPDNLSGTAGVDNPATVGEDAVHIILGVGSFTGTADIDFTNSTTTRELPKAEAVKFRFNDQPQTAVETWHAFRNTDIKQQWFDTPTILTEDDDIYAEFIGGEAGAESLYLIGLSFVESKPMRQIVPADMAGSNSDNIVTW